MDRKQKCRKYYTDNKGYLCFFCKVKCTRDGDHNRSLEHLTKMSEALNIPIELIIPTNTYSRKCEIKRALKKEYLK